MGSAGQCQVVPFIVECRAEFIWTERVPWIAGVVTEGAAIFIVAHGAGQGVIRDQTNFMEATLAIADVHAIVARTPSRGFVTHAPQTRHACRLECGIERPEEAAGGTGSRYSGDVIGINRNIGVEVDGLVLVQAEHVNVLGFNYRLRSDRPGVAAVELRGYRGAIGGIHNAPG